MKRISASVNAAVEEDGVGAPRLERHGGAKLPNLGRRHLLTRPFDASRYYAALILFGVTSAVFSLGAVPLQALLPRGAGIRIGRAAISACFRVYLRVVAWVGLLRVDLSPLAALRDERELLIVANHPSILDAVLLVAALPRAACIMKGSLAESRILGGGASLAGYMRNTSPPRLIRDAVGCLRDGGQLLVFPEGTRTTGPTLDRFTAGFAVMAKRAGVPIQAVVIEMVRGLAWRRSVFKTPVLPLTFRIRLGRRYAPCDDPRWLAQRIEADLRADLQAASADDRVYPTCGAARSAPS